MHPELLALAPPLLALLALLVGRRWRRLRRVAAVYGEDAAARLVPVRLDRFPIGRLALLMGGALACLIAAAEPVPRAPEPAPPPEPLDLAIAVDVSRSMAAADAHPTRVLRAAEVVRRLAAELPGARLSLVIFADWPYTLVPPSDDPDVLTYFAGSLATDLLAERDQGTSLARALQEARRALDARPREGARRAIVLVSDGGAHEPEAELLRAASAAAAEDVPVWVAALGTEGGAQLGTAAEPVLDAQGLPVTAALDERLLRAVARAGGGSYRHVADGRGLAALLTDLARGPEPRREGAGPAFDVVTWLALLALAALLLESALDADRAARRIPRGGAW